MASQGLGRSPSKPRRKARLKRRAQYRNGDGVFVGRAQREKSPVFSRSKPLIFGDRTCYPRGKAGAGCLLRGGETALERVGRYDRLGAGDQTIVGGGRRCRRGRGIGHAWLQRRPRGGLFGIRFRCRILRDRCFRTRRLVVALGLDGLRFGRNGGGRWRRSRSSGIRGSAAEADLAGKAAEEAFVGLC